jgi:hypothetical protein
VIRAAAHLTCEMEIFLLIVAISRKMFNDTRKYPRLICV